MHVLAQPPPAPRPPPQCPASIASHPSRGSTGVSLSNLQCRSSPFPAHIPPMAPQLPQEKAQFLNLAFKALTEWPLELHDSFLI